MSPDEKDPVDVLLPQSGMGMQDGEIVRWLKEEGATVSEGEILVEVEAAKALVEIESPCAGVLKKILARAGETVEVRAVIAQVAPQ
ncbi:MAG: biotin attachment protein [Gammaproteobacteria bacterium]|nr:biotin attachment protein [Gammaproteobacteria bacterium]